MHKLSQNAQTEVLHAIAESYSRFLDAFPEESSLDFANEDPLRPVDAVLLQISGGETDPDVLTGWLLRQLSKQLMYEDCQDILPSAELIATVRGATHNLITLYQQVEDQEGLIDNLASLLFLLRVEMFAQRSQKRSM